MSTIFPGNYVAALNAYRDQGVLAVPGVEFYQAIGAAIISTDQTGGPSLTVEVQSPDLRQDDKPRLNKVLTVPANAVVYRTAISTVNLKASGTQTVKVEGLTTGTAEASLAAVSGDFPAAGSATGFDGFASGASNTSAESSAAVITAKASGNLTIIDKDSQAAVLVEVCYFVPADAPDSDSVSLPYKTEAGQGY